MTSNELVGWLLQNASANPTVADHLNSFVTDGQPRFIRPCPRWPLARCGTAYSGNAKPS